jgi:hypothetical protein
MADLAGTLANIGNLPTTLMGLLFGPNVLWSIRAPELDVEFEAQFEPIGLRMSAGGNYAMTQTLGRQYPIAQWLSGEADTVSFTGRLYARHFLDKPADKLKTLIKLTKRDRNLGRPPICEFSMGQGFMVIRCFVSEIGNIVFDSFRHDGSVRGAMFKVTLVRYEPYGLKETDTTTPEPSTVYKVAKEGETFESVAAKLYNNAIKGVNLRKVHPQYPELQIGDVVKVLPVTHSKIQKKIEPDYHLYQDTPVARAAMEAIHASRASSFNVYIYKK